ncbi:site-specific integrase [Vibrio splendidus]|nr:site-specific integrase [Vibrio splendidus]
MSLATSSSASNEVIHSYNTMTNCGADPVTFERPTRKTHRVVKRKTCFEILDEYTKCRIKLKKSKRKNINQDKNILKIFLHFMGFPELNELDRLGAEQIAHAYCYRPKNPKKYKEFKGLEGFDLIARNESLLKPRDYIALSTAKGHFQKMSTFLAWAKSHGYVTDNVFYKLPTAKTNKEKKCFPFTEKHLQDIFSISDYEKHKYLHPYYYWVPLLLRYTGARLNEICQLWVNDVVVADGFHCIIIRETFDNQSVKTGVTRLIPLHNELLEKGFIEFINSKKSGQIFPELEPTNGYFSHNASKWFARRREAIGIESGEGFNAHSFRHNFVNELKQKLVSMELVESIAGHENAEKLAKSSNDLVKSVIGLEHGSESFDTYSYQYSPTILAPVVNMIDTSHTASVLPYMQKKATA